MIPSDLKSLIAKMSPRPWRQFKDSLVDDHDILVGVTTGGRPSDLHDDEAAIVALANRAEALCELWEAARQVSYAAHDAGLYGGRWDRLNEVLAKLEAVQ